MALLADLILKNGEIYSVGKDGVLSVNESMAIAGDKIIYVGDAGGSKELEGERTKLIDLRGNTVLPGLCDSHLHASMTAEQVYDFTLYDIQPYGEYDREKLIKDYRERAKRKVEAEPDAPIYRGVGWDPALFQADPKGMPTADELDGVCDDKPIMIRSYDHHYVWVNNKALKESGITKDTPTPRNGIIERDEEGNPTGIFQEVTATDLLINNLPNADYSIEEYKEGIKAYQERFANNYGTVLVFDAFNSANGMQAYYEMAKAGELTIRVKTCFYADPSLPESQFDQMIQKKGKYDCGDIFDVRTVKFFMDGSGLAFYMKEPFNKDFLLKIGLNEDNRGYPQWSLDEIKKAFLKLDSAGFQIHVHCMGDGASEMTLDAFEYVASKNGTGNRHTITHLMQFAEEDIKRMKDLNVIAAMQPMWFTNDSFAEYAGFEFFGEEKTLEQYPFGQLVRAGVTVSSGTDFPITIPPNPYIGIQTGITRRVARSHPDFEAYGHKILGPASDPLKNVASLKDMVASYSINGAYQCFLEDTTGSLEVGKSADFVILSKKLTETPEDEIETIEAAATYFKGKLVYEK